MLQVAKADTQRRAAVDRLRRGYVFIGTHYRHWLDTGVRLLQEAMVARLRLSSSDTEALIIEPFTDYAVPDAIPTEPVLRHSGAEPYPLPAQIRYTFYLVTSSMLVVSPAETSHVSVLNPGLLSRVAAAARNFRESPAVVDLEATSRAAADSPDQGAVIRLPESLSSHELYFQEFVNVQYTTSDNDTRSGVVVTMRDGREITVPGTQQIADLVRQHVRRHKVGNVRAGGVIDAFPEGAVDPDEGSASGDGFKMCPMCAENVRSAAKLCRFCGHSFAE